MSKLPKKYEWAIPADLNTFKVKEDLKAAGLRYGEGPSGDTCWHAADEATWRKGMQIAMAAGEAPDRRPRPFMDGRDHFKARMRRIENNDRRMGGDMYAGGASYYDDRGNFVLGADD
ncbi:hypothetical protein [Xanthobacter sediminis]